MSTEFEIWFFLIGRSYDIDYRVIVTPEFLYKRGGTHLLSLATGDIDFTENNYFLSRQVYTDCCEPFTIIFRTTKLKHSLIKSSSFEEIKFLHSSKETDFILDQYGREINILEGFVVKTTALDNFHISRELFEDMHRVLVNYFKAFWQGDTETKIISSSIYRNSDYDKYYWVIKKIKPLDLRDSQPPEPDETLCVKSLIRWSLNNYVYLVSLAAIFLLLTHKIIDNLNWQLVNSNDTESKKVYVNRATLDNSDKNDVKFDYKIEGHFFTFFKPKGSADCQQNKLGEDIRGQKNISDKSKKSILYYVCDPKQSDTKE
jgi:hypothetical protein